MLLYIHKKVMNVTTTYSSRERERERACVWPGRRFYIGVDIWILCPNGAECGDSREKERGASMMALERCV